MEVERGTLRGHCELKPLDGAGIERRASVQPRSIRGAIDGADKG